MEINESFNTNLDFKQYQVDADARKDIKKALTGFDACIQDIARSMASNMSASSNMINEVYYHAPTANSQNLYETYAAQPQAPQQQNYSGFPTAMQSVKYAVFPLANQAGKTRYTIADQVSGQKIVEGLHLSEGANAITKMLNGGHSFYSPQIRQILEFEDKYKKHYSDAVSFSRQVKNDTSRDALLETRFNEAKTNALTVKHQLLEFVKKV